MVQASRWLQSAEDADFFESVIEAPSAIFRSRKRSQRSPELHRREDWDRNLAQGHVKLQ